MHNSAIARDGIVEHYDMCNETDTLTSISAGSLHGSLEHLWEDRNDTSTNTISKALSNTGRSYRTDNCKESLRDKISASKSSPSGDSIQLAAPRKKWTDTRQDNTAIQTDRIVDTSSSDESIPLTILKKTWTTRKPPENSESNGPTVKIDTPG